MAKKKQATKDFVVILELKGTGELLRGEGDTLHEAMDNVKLSGTAKTLGIITMSSPNGSITKVLTAPKVNRMFNVDGNQEMKRLSAQSFVKFIKTAL